MTKTVEVPAYDIECRVAVDPGTTALVVVDMQTDFVDEDGRLPVPGARETVPRIARLLAWARRLQLTIVFTQDSHREGDPEWDIWGRHAEVGTPGWAIVPALAPRAGELVIPKVRYDAFYGTSMDHELRLRGIDTLVICGTVANICVHYTAASAALRWYRVLHPVDALSALSPFDLESALRQAAFLFQAVLTTTDALLSSSPEN
jgi:nicotinamidase-related amidase